MKCPDCYSEIPEGSGECPECGRDVAIGAYGESALFTTRPGPYSNRFPGRLLRIVAVMIAITVIAGGAGALILWLLASRGLEPKETVRSVYDAIARFDREDVVREYDVDGGAEEGHGPQSVTSGIDEIEAMSISDVSFSNMSYSLKLNDDRAVVTLLHGDVSYRVKDGELEEESFGEGERVWPMLPSRFELARTNGEWRVTSSW